MSKSRHISRPRAKWTDDMLQIMLKRYPYVSTRVLASELQLSDSQVYAQAARMGLKKSEQFYATPASGRLGHGQGFSCRFQKGHLTWNKGTHYIAGGRSEQTRFKKGRKPEEAHNYLPIGSLRITKDGILVRKTTDDPNVFPARRWIPVYRLVWEAAHGPIPKGKLVRFKQALLKTTVLQDITLDKLEMVSMSDNMRQNSYHNRYPKEIAQLIQIRGAVQRQINKKMKDEQNLNEK